MVYKSLNTILLGFVCTSQQRFAEFQPLDILFENREGAQGTHQRGNLDFYWGFRLSQQPRSVIQTPRTSLVSGRHSLQQIRGVLMHQSKGIQCNTLEVDIMRHILKDKSNMQHQRRSTPSQILVRIRTLQNQPRGQNLSFLTFWTYR